MAIMQLGEIAKRLGCELRGAPETEIERVWPIETARAGDLSFIANVRYARYLETTRASALILDPEMGEVAIPTLRTPEPYLAFARALRLFHQPPPRRAGTHPTAVIAADARIGPGASIGPHVVIEAAVTIGAAATIGAGSVIGYGAVIGDRFTAYPRVVIREAVTIGDDVVLHAGVVIGSDGFGYVPSAAGELEKILQSGTVVIGDDVEIGANATVDRATVGETRIGKGVKIDNLVQVGHGCEIGEHTVVAAQSGLAGSSHIGSWVQLGGQVGTAGHQTIGDLARVAAKSGVVGDVAPGAVVAGIPAIPIEKWRRGSAGFLRLAEILRRLRRLEKALLPGDSGDAAP
jgi:UDP-3-O-[3-hydroxymyristoyl] glucosamine N-acyltransferase